MKRTLMIGLSLWAVGFYYIHGPVLLAYLAIQVATTGTFVYFMSRAEK